MEADGLKDAEGEIEDEIETPAKVHPVLPPLSTELSPAYQIFSGVAVEFLISK